jgi:hypothetical protein
LVLFGLTWIYLVLLGRLAEWAVPCLVRRLAALAAALTFGFVSRIETAPIRIPAFPDMGTPELLD